MSGHFSPGMKVPVYASADRVELARLRGDTVHHRRVRYGRRGMGGLGDLLTVDAVRAMETANNAAVERLVSKIRAARVLLATPFVGANESVGIASWAGRASALLTDFYSTQRVDSYQATNGTIDIPSSQIDFAEHANTLLSQWTEVGFDDVQHKATVRTASTGFVVVALVGAGLWYVKKHKGK